METLFYYGFLPDMTRAVEQGRVHPDAEYLRVNWNVRLPWARMGSSNSRPNLRLVWGTTHDLQDPMPHLGRLDIFPEIPLNERLASFFRFAISLDKHRHIPWDSYKRISELNPRHLQLLEQQMEKIGHSPDSFWAVQGSLPLNEIPYIDHYVPLKGWERIQSKLYTSWV